ncbi:MAG: hypothetical protein K5787_18445 [Lentisphaeria bacterium]|nr:hypothetical protein [Lentisphaeria bacterium]
MSFFIAILSGLLGGFGGVGYKISGSGKVNALQSASVLAFFGVIFFGIRAAMFGEWQLLTWQMVVLTIVTGVAQYLGQIMLKVTLDMGPLSLVWCAAALQFMPAIIFSYFAYNEPFTVFYLLALAALFAAIVSASFGQEKPADDKLRTPAWLFGLALLAMLTLFSSCAIAMKFGWYYHVPGSSESLMQNNGNVFFCLLYAAIFTFCTADVIIRKTLHFSVKGWIGNLMLAFGTILQFTLQKSVLHLPAALLFALSCSASILFTCIISTTFFHEKRTRSWYLTLLFALLAISFMALSPSQHKKNTPDINEDSKTLIEKEM